MLFRFLNYIIGRVIIQIFKFSNVGANLLRVIGDEGIETSFCGSAKETN